MSFHLLALLMIVSICTVQPTRADSRDVVEQIATLIENNYFDSDKANAVASELRDTARSGAFNNAAEPRDLAANLTARLRPFDQHFNVIFLRAPSPTDGPAAIAGGPGQQPFGRPTFGFRSVAMLPGSIGYIDMRSFSYIVFREPNDPARLAADAALQLIAGAAAVIIDLRNNFGGYPEMVGYLVSAFTPADADIYNVVHKRDGKQTERPKELYRYPRLKVPLYILISGSTASAAESAAYTLQAVKRATLVGERTAGAANPGGEFPVGEGFNVFISTGTPINPITGANWEGAGLEPDVPTPSEEALRRAQILALEALLKDAGESGATEVQWVLEALRAEGTAQTATALGDYPGTYADATIKLTGNALQLRRGRRSALTLVRLREETFFVSDEPGRRVVFERDTAGKVRGFQLLRAGGQSIWYPHN